jgi:hypothetical protein
VRGAWHWSPDRCGNDLVAVSEQDAASAVPTS